LSFYISDIDKVASAAYKISYNELLALVFLLLIAIIVVISISRPSNQITTKIIHSTPHTLYNFISYHTSISNFNFFIINYMSQFLRQ